MAGDWVERTLGELTDNFDGKRMPVRESDRRPGPYPYYGASGIVDHVDQHLFDGEYLLIAEDGENLRTRNTPVAFLARGKFWVNNHAHIVRGNNSADTRFLMYALSATDISGYLTGSTMPKLTQGNMNRIPLLAPPLPEQRAVARILGALDDKIDLNRRTSDTLEGIARALFESRFGNSNGWQMGALSEVVQLRRDQENPLESPDTVFVHFSIPAFDDGQSPALERGENIKSLKSRVPGGVILLSKLNPEIERVWLVDVNAQDRAVCSTEFLVLHPRSPFDRAYVYCLARSSAFRRQIEALVTGTSKSHQRAQADAILDLPIALPTKDAVTTFQKAASPLLDRVLACRRESKTLAELRDFLLPKLISGELRVSEAEKIAEEAA